MRPELAALVVHDLKNSLGVLEAQLCALQHEPSHGLAVAAYRHCADMRQRFVMFLTLYAAEGEMQAQCSDESPVDFLASMLPPVVAADAAAGVRLGACDGAPPYWFFDFRLVRMALAAALHNARRFARTQVLLGAREDAGWLVFTVDDDGPGLGHHDGAPGATGLGTELCAAVARAHGTAERPGRVVLSNRDEGGARFELWLG